MNLEIGCGPKNRWIADTVGIDQADFGQKYIGDYLNYEFKEKFDVIYLHHVIEHIDDTIALFNKLGNDLKDNGVLDIRVPLCTSLLAFQDPTHVKFIPGPQFFSYFTKDSPAGHCYSEKEFSIVNSDNDRYDWELHIVMRL